MIVEIADLNAPELDVYARLTQPQLRADGLFVVESVKVISYALDAGCVPVSFLMERRRLEQARSVTERALDVYALTASSRREHMRTNVEASEIKLTDDECGWLDLEIDR